MLMMLMNTPVAIQIDVALGRAAADDLEVDRQVGAHDHVDREVQQEVFAGADQDQHDR